MTPTPEQAEIIAFIKNRTENLLVNALAGTAKTTTIEMACRAKTDVPILYLVFNKRNADEAKKRLPPHVEARTFNSLGHRVWAQTINRRLNVKLDKNRDILKTLIEAMPKRLQGAAYEDYADTMRWIRYAKTHGYVPPGAAIFAPTGYHISDTTKWLDRFDELPPDIALVNNAMTQSIVQAHNGLVDYDDQIYMPTVFGAKWPQFPLVITDESQDLSALNHEIIWELAKNNRLVAVGDPWQSIYAFRGATVNGMRALQQRFNMEELQLSVTFRVPQSGVIRARDRVPHFKWADGAAEGHIEVLEEWNSSSIPEGAAIVCRNNAPLFRAALRLLRKGRNIKLVGMDIGPGLIKILKKLGGPDTPASEFAERIELWERAERARKDSPIIDDKVECLLALTEGRATLRDAIQWAEDLFKRAGTIQLLSIHKVKGLEYETVFHLDPWRIPSKWAKPDTEEWEQELNARYVAETRFKKNLYLVDTIGWRE